MTQRWWHRLLTLAGITSGSLFLLIGFTPPALADNCSTPADCAGASGAASMALIASGLAALVGGLAALSETLSTGAGTKPPDTSRGEGQAEGTPSGSRRALAPLGGPATIAGLPRPGSGRPASQAAPTPSRTGALGAQQAARYPGAGDRFSLPPGPLALADLYREETNPVTKRAITEQLGESGALTYLRAVTDPRSIGLLRPVSDTDVADLADLVAAGQPWYEAVAFGGRNATNLVYFDGETLHIVEAKGGSGPYGTRTSHLIKRGRRISQMNPEYPQDVAHDMQNSSIADGRNTIGVIIDNAYEDRIVRYVGVRTGDAAALRTGDPTIIVEHVFLEPS